MATYRKKKPTYSKKSSSRRRMYKTPTSYIPRSSLPRSRLPARNGYTLIKRTLMTGGTSSAGGSTLWLDTYNGFFPTTASGVPTGAGAGFNLQITFQLSGISIYIGGGPLPAASISMPDYTEFTNLYDNYRVKQVNIKLLFSNNMSNVTSPGAPLPTMVIAKDYDDIGDRNAGQLLEYDSARIIQLGTSPNNCGYHSFYLKPKPLVQMYNTSTSSGYAVQNNASQLWMSTAYPNVPHYGIKMAVNGPLAPSASVNYVGAVQLIVSYQIELKNTK